MDEQQQVEQTNPETIPDTTAELIGKIKELKETTVSRQKYDELAEQNRQLMDLAINGGDAAASTVEETKDIAEMRKELFMPDKELSNLEYISKALDLREAVLEQTGEDIFVGKGHVASPEQADYDKAEKAANVFKECIEAADGNNEKFVAELNSRIRDVGFPVRKK